LNNDRLQYIKALRLGNEEKYAEMVFIFADMVISQRMNVLEESLKKIVETEGRGQMSLSDFIRK
jgi:hypothetical protein